MLDRQPTDYIEKRVVAHGSCPGSDRGRVVPISTPPRPVGRYLREYFWQVGSPSPETNGEGALDHTQTDEDLGQRQRARVVLHKGVSLPHCLQNLVGEVLQTRAAVDQQSLGDRSRYSLFEPELAVAPLGERLSYALNCQLNSFLPKYLCRELDLNEDFVRDGMEVCE